VTWSTKVVVCSYDIHLNKKEMSITKVIGYWLFGELPNHLIDYNFTYILSNSSTWVHKHEINEINQNGMLKVAICFFGAKVIKKMVRLYWNDESTNGVIVVEEAKFKKIKNKKLKNVNHHCSATCEYWGGLPRN
jgi:hypothetical protein